MAARASQSSACRSPPPRWIPVTMIADVDRCCHSRHCCSDRVYSNDTYIDIRAWLTKNTTQSDSPPRAAPMLQVTSRSSRFLAPRLHYGARSAAVSVGVPRRGSRTEREERSTAFAETFGRPIRARRNQRLAAQERDNAVARKFHQVARRRRSRNPEEHVTRREGVHRGTACLAMLRGAMTALASPPSSPPKQPPLSPHPPTLVPSDTPCYSHAPYTR